MEKVIYYDDGNNILKEIFTTDESYLKKSFSNYERDYTYNLGKLYSITTDYSKNSGLEEEKGIYTANAEKVINSYNNGTYVKNIEYNANMTVYKYNLSSAFAGIECSTVMGVIGDEDK